MDDKCKKFSERLAEAKLFESIIDAQALSIKSQIMQRILDGKETEGSMRGNLNYETYTQKRFSNVTQF